MENAQTPSTNVNMAKKHIPDTGLISPGGKQLLDTIDDLRRSGIEEDIPLPQIVVVGSQAAGKSSVLEAISGIAFPIKGGQCTSFPTEIRLRRAREEKIAISVVSQFPSQPGEESVESLDASALLGGSKIKDLDWRRMPALIEQAHEAMLRKGDHKFCGNILRIEVSGPTQDHLTLIDVPGLSHSPGPGQDAEAPARVRSTVNRYMREKQSIMLAVISAKDDWKDQEILKLTESVDEHGTRTLGVITGVDLPSEGSFEEKMYVSQARNEKTILERGWHVLRNLSGDDRRDGKTLSERNDIEAKFFASRSAWHAVPEQDRGATELKTKLSGVLLKHIGKQLGVVINSLEEAINRKGKKLKQLGDERSTIPEKRAYLTKLAARHENLCKIALKGPYDDQFFTLTQQRLRAMVIQKYKLFVKAMMNGHKWEVDIGQTLSVRHRDAIGEVSSSGLPSAPSKISRDAYLLKVEQVVIRERGPELNGLSNPHLVGVLFKDQACRWESIARHSLLEINDVVQKFMKATTEYVVDQRRAATLLRYHLLPALESRKHAVLAKLEELIKPFQRSLPWTENPMFNISRRRIEEMRKPETSLFHLSSQWTEETPKLDHLDMHQYCNNLTRYMQNYYDIARATFVDNIISLGVELCLLDGLPDIFAPVAVTKMTDKEIDQLASEFPEDIVNREKTTRDLIFLCADLVICRQYEQYDPSSDLVAPSAITGNEHLEMCPTIIAADSPDGQRVQFSSPTPKRRNMAHRSPRPSPNRPNRSSHPSPSSTWTLGDSTSPPLIFGQGATINVEKPKETTVQAEGPSFRSDRPTSLVAPTFAPAPASVGNSPAKSAPLFGPPVFAGSAVPATSAPSFGPPVFAGQSHTGAGGGGGGGVFGGGGDSFGGGGGLFPEVGSAAQGSTSTEGNLFGGSRNIIKPRSPGRSALAASGTATGGSNSSSAPYTGQSHTGASEDRGVFRRGRDVSIRGGSAAQGSAGTGGDNLFGGSPNSVKPSSTSTSVTSALAAVGTTPVNDDNNNNNNDNDSSAPFQGFSFGTTTS